MKNVKDTKRWEIGILIIPYRHGYDEEGRLNEFGNTMIPPYSTLVFYLETNKGS